MKAASAVITTIIVTALSLTNSSGELFIYVLQDRDCDFEPKIVLKRKKDISEIEQKIIYLVCIGIDYTANIFRNR